MAAHAAEVRRLGHGMWNGRLSSGDDKPVSYGHALGERTSRDATARDATATTSRATDPHHVAPTIFLSIIAAISDPARGCLLREKNAKGFYGQTDLPDRDIGRITTRLRVEVHSLLCSVVWRVRGLPRLCV